VRPGRGSAAEGGEEDAPHGAEVALLGRDRARVRARARVKVRVMGRGRGRFTVTARDGVR